MDAGALLFWGFATLIGLSVVWAGFLGRREAEHTIRMAIERGVPLDAESIRELRFGVSRRTPGMFVVSGVLLASVALALAVFGFIIAPEEPDTLVPLLGIATFLAIPALTITATGLWLLRRRSGTAVAKGR
jgi:hypothetical protein